MGMEFKKLHFCADVIYAWLRAAPPWELGFLMYLSNRGKILRNMEYKNDWYKVQTIQIYEKIQFVSPLEDTKMVSYLILLVLEIRVQEESS